MHAAWCSNAQAVASCMHAIELCSGEELSFNFRRPTTEQEILNESWSMLLSATFELREYALHHRLTPTKACALLATSNSSIIKQIMRELQEEWSTILAMEASGEGKHLLHSKCLFVTYQQTREILTCLEKNAWELNKESQSLIGAWFPAIQSSANLETVFGDISSAISRSGKTDCGSLANMMAVGIRAVSRRFGEDDEAGDPVALESSDWASKEVPGLKAKIWCPSSAPACISPHPHPTPTESRSTTPAEFLVEPNPTLKQPTFAMKYKLQAASWILTGSARPSPPQRPTCTATAPSTTSWDSCSARSPSIIPFQCMQPLPRIECLPRSSQNPVDTARHWWAADCMQRGMVFRSKNSFYVCCGRSPAIVHVTRPRYSLFPNSSMK